MADAVRQRRLAIGLTQAGLSSRSGVALGTLRKFERTGLASTEAFVKLLSVVGGLEAVMEATRPANLPFASIDAVLEEPPEALRKRGWRS
jgi:transcriptional regulator with XRE-family HTH domain